MTKILIHGINNQRNSKDKIERAWSDALQRGARAIGEKLPGDVEFSAAFYGDILHEETESWSANASAAQRMSAISPDEDYAD